MAQMHFYDEQIRRFLLQFARIFSNFQVSYGRDESSNETLVRVPVRYGDASRQAQTIIQENSANSLPSAPLMTFYISALEYDRPRIQEPYFVSKMSVRQRFYDENTDTYETTQGNAFTIERLMPVPYKMTINLDIWTSNTNQKWQLIEQIAPLFNPSLEIQSTDNFIDWTSLSVVELESTNYSSRTIPVGTENPIDIFTYRFNIPIWISSPAKVKKLGVVEKIVASVFDVRGDAADSVLNSDLLMGTRQKFTPYNYQTLLLGNKVQLLKYSAVVDSPNESVVAPDNPPSNELWKPVVNLYGVLRPGISQLRFDYPWDETIQIVGTVSYDPMDDRFLLIDIDEDTAPQNTLDPINAVINPQTSGPGAGLPPAALGQSYLILEDIGNANNPMQPTAWSTDDSAWYPLQARANDIIEFNGTEWVISFNAAAHANDVEYVTNITTGIQYRWANGEWVKSYEGLYPGGEWSLVL